MLSTYWEYTVAITILLKTVFLLNFASGWSVQILSVLLDVTQLRSQENVDFNFFVQVSFDEVGFILHEDDAINVAKVQQILY